MDKQEKKNNHQHSENDTKDSTPATHQETPSTDHGAPKKKGSWQMVLTVIAIIAVILIFTLPGDREDDALLGDDTEMTDEETSSSTDSSDAGTTALPVAGSSVTTAMSPVSIGDEFTYRFNDIEWFFSAEDNENTEVAFKFSEFSRRQGSIVAFGNPYRIGQFEGTCNEIGSLSVGNNDDTALSFSSCRTDANNGVDIAIFQDNSNPARVYVAQRTVENRRAGEFVDFFELDITTIVR
jgi:hypothetical protein